MSMDIMSMEEFGGTPTTTTTSSSNKYFYYKDQEKENKAVKPKDLFGMFDQNTIIDDILAGDFEQFEKLYTLYKSNGIRNTFNRLKASTIINEVIKGVFFASFQIINVYDKKESDLKLYISLFDFLYLIHKRNISSKLKSKEMDNYNLFSKAEIKLFKKGTIDTMLANRSLPSESITNEFLCWILIRTNYDPFLNFTKNYSALFYSIAKDKHTAKILSDFICDELTFKTKEKITPNNNSGGYVKTQNKIMQALTNILIEHQYNDEHIVTQLYLNDKLSIRYLISILRKNKGCLGSIRAILDLNYKSYFDIDLNIIQDYVKNKEDKRFINYLIEKKKESTDQKVAFSNKHITRF